MSARSARSYLLVPAALAYFFIDIKQSAVGSQERAWALLCVVAQAAARATTLKLPTL